MSVEWSDTGDATYAWHIDAHLSARRRGAQVMSRAARAVMTAAEAAEWAWYVDTGHRHGRPMASGVAASREEAKRAMLGVMAAAEPHPETAGLDTKPKRMAWGTP